MGLLDRLGVRLALLLAVSLLLLFAAGAALITYGFGSTNERATALSVSGLLEQGGAALAQVTAAEARLSDLQLRQAADVTRTAAQYLGAALELGVTPPPPARLALGAEGERYDAAPERRTDLFLGNRREADAATARDLADSALLDALLPALLTEYEAAIAIYYHSPTGLTRYYPPIGLHELVPADLEVGVQEQFTQAAPDANPERRVVWRSPYSDDAQHGLLVTASAPVYAHGEFRGVVAVDVSLARLADHLESLELTPRSRALLLDGAGKLVAASAAALTDLRTGVRSPGGYLVDSALEFGADLRSTTNPELAGVVAEMTGGAAAQRQLVLGGEELLVSYAPLPTPGWSLAVLTPLTDLTGPSQGVARAIRADALRTLRSALLLLAFSLLAALAAAASFSRRWFLRPIRTLSAGAVEVAGGNLGVELPVARRDELGLLAASFNEMAASLSRGARELAEREGQYRSIFESTSDGIIITNRAGHVVEANPAACAMHGYTREEFIGMARRDYVHPDSHHLLDRLRRDLRAGEVVETRATDLRKDGSTFSVEVRITSLLYRGEPHMLGVVRDVTERVQAYELLEQRVEERTRELTALLDLSREASAMLALDPLLDLVLARLNTVIDFTAAAIFVLDGPERLRLLRYRGPIPQDALTRTWELARATHNREVVTAKAPVIIPDVRSGDPLARAFRAVAREQLGEVPAYIGTWMGVPLISRDRVIGMLTFDHGEPGYYTLARAGLTLAFAGQAAAAIENARLYGEAQGKAALEERQRLARELHDSVSQALYGIVLGTRTAKTLLTRDPARVAEPLEYVMGLAEAGIAEMRALIFELRPESLEQEGLVAALAKQAASAQARHGLTVDLDLTDEPGLALEAKQALHRIAQEALHNVVKHAGAARVRLGLASEGARVVLVIEDDGRGFDSGGSFPGHLGLTSMRERAEALGGSLEIASAPGAGTRVAAAVPLRRSS